MDKKRIETNIKNLKLAKNLLQTAFEDLKNVESFREHPNSGAVVRNILLGMVEQVTSVAELCLKGKRE